MFLDLGVFPCFIDNLSRSYFFSRNSMVGGPQKHKFWTLLPPKGTKYYNYSIFLVVIHGVFSSLFIVFFGVLYNILDNFDKTHRTLGKTSIWVYSVDPILDPFGLFWTQKHNCWLLLPLKPHFCSIFTIETWRHLFFIFYGVFFCVVDYLHFYR